MKIELEAKPGYEWVEVSRAKWLDSPEEQTSAVWRQSGDINRYFLLQPIKPKYDYSDWANDSLVSEHDLLCFEMGFTEEGDVLGEKIKCCKDEILRRMNKED